MCPPNDAAAREPGAPKIDEDLLKQWERFSDASHHEKQWMHERFNWLMVSQPILFTALAFAVKERKFNCDVQAPDLKGAQFQAAVDECARQGAILNEVLVAVILLGFVISSLVFIGLVAAGRMHWVWTSNLNKLAARLSIDGAGDPICTFGIKPHWPARTSSLIAPTVSAVFAVLWGYLLLTIPDIRWETRWLVTGIDLILVAFVWSFARLARSTLRKKPTFARLP